MKKVVMTLCVAFAAFMVLSAFVPRATVMSGIHGTVTPAEAAKKVWAISGTDTASVIPVAGNFTLDVKPGTWQIKVEAAAPYKDATVDNIVVEEGKSADAGQIKLSQ
jgi:hypothetical protein